MNLVQPYGGGERGANFQDILEQDQTNLHDTHVGHNFVDKGLTGMYIFATNLILYMHVTSYQRWLHMCYERPDMATLPEVDRYMGYI